MATTLFNTKDVTDYYDPLAGLADKPHYMFAARSTPWADDLNIPDIETNSGFTDYSIFDEMVFGKLITANDIAYMTRRVDWTYGTVYARYDNTDPNLATSNFYVVYQEAGAFHVFKCLDNNNGSPSSYPPKLSETSISDSQYYTADGYHWRYIYTVDSITFTKFATSDFMPVFPNTAAQALVTPGSLDAIILSTGGSSYFSSANGTFQSIAVGGNTQVFALDPTKSSSNNGFYVGSSVYIKSGAGAGQLRDITSYIISGNNYLLGVNTAFTTLPDLTSTYQISPKVTIVGDGVGAKAISSVNTVTNSISSVKMITPGLGYTYANVQITGNTGGLVVANTALASAAIAPKGGHASNPLGELYANRIGLSISFMPTDTQIPPYGTYRRVGILAQPTYDNVAITIANASTSFLVGEQLVQPTSVNTVVTAFSSAQYQYSNQYNPAQYNILQFTAPVAFANDQVVVQGGTSGVVIDKLSTNSLLVRTDVGAWVNATSVQLSGNTSTNGTISSISSGLNNGVIYGRDDANTLFTYNSSTDTFSVFVGSTLINSASRAGPTDPQYTVNATAMTITNATISNSTLVIIDRFTSNLSQQTISSNTQLFVQGTVKSANSTTLIVDDVSGLFTNAATISGISSTAQATIAGIVGQETSFDYRTFITGSYVVGSAQFSTSNTIYQYDAFNNVAGSATIHHIANVGNNYTFAVTDMKGTISPAKYLQSVSGDKRFLVNSVTPPNIVSYQGDIRYVENFLPVQRSNTQTETIRLVLTFY